MNPLDISPLAWGVLHVLVITVAGGFGYYAADGIIRYVMGGEE